MEPYSYRSDADISDFPDDQPILVFDGHCALCSGWVDFLLKRDRGAFRFIPAQSALGEALYAHYGLKSDDYETNILIEKGIARLRADGTLAMFRYLGWPWRAVRLFRILPNSWLNWGYRLIARNRLRWFGRREVCRLPQPNERERFL